MISLEGLTLLTGRHGEARSILHTFARHVRDGLIPNLFPEGETEGLYHTADATLWFFHALDRYEQATGEHETRRFLLPKLVDIVERHLAARASASASMRRTACSARARRATSSPGWTPRSVTGW